MFILSLSNITFDLSRRMRTAPDRLVKISKSSAHHYPHFGRFAHPDGLLPMGQQNISKETRVIWDE
jgi:hypothetical protein